MLRKEKVYQHNDERILGDGDYVARVLSSAQEAMEKRYKLLSAGVDLDQITTRVSNVLAIEPQEVWVKGKHRRTVKARSLLCYWAVRELGIPMATLARKLGISVPSVSESVIRGKRLAEEKGFFLTET